MVMYHQKVQGNKKNNYTNIKSKKKKTATIVAVFFILNIYL